MHRRRPGRRHADRSDLRGPRMTTSHATTPIMAILGKRDLELGPFAIGEAPQEAGPWTNWRMRTDEDGIAWLLFDKKDANANTLSAEVLAELDAVLEKVERDHRSEE